MAIKSNYLQTHKVMWFCVKADTSSSVVTGQSEGGAAAWAGSSDGRKRGWQSSGDAGREGEQPETDQCWGGAAAPALHPGAASRVPESAALSGAEWSQTKCCAVTSQVFLSFSGLHIYLVSKKYMHVRKDGALLLILLLLYCAVPQYLMLLETWEYKERCWRTWWAIYTRSLIHINKPLRILKMKRYSLNGIYNIEHGVSNYNTFSECSKNV